ncbi:MAG: branched-chain amino acid transporter permease [Chloroflexi bacterium]|nr:branched-chain amino acid transporter permease [Chloroflexota bacterium]MDB5077093.1 branched-chain amino acid transporter permease [Chloroflexota bacterium]
MNQFLQSLPDTLVQGLAIGMMYALIALGYTLVYGILELINFAHGDVFMLGGLFSWAALQHFFGAQIGANYGVLGGGTLVMAIILAFLIATVSCGGVGFVIERFAYRPLRNAPKLAPLVTAIGVSFIIENAVLVWQTGTGNMELTYPSLINQQIIPVLGLHIPSKAIIVFVTAPILMVGLLYLVGNTRMGKAMRATAQDQEAARMMGIDVNRVISFTFIVGSVLAGCAGVIYALYYNSIDYSVGFLAGLKAFTAAVLGGIGNIRGAMLGGLLVGEVESIVDSIDASQGVGLQWAEPAVFLVLMCVLIFRPTGLLGAQVVDKA